MREKHLLIFDGDCGFCQWSQARLMRRDRRGQFESVARQRCTSPPMTAELSERLGREIVVWTRDEQYLGGADAVLFFLEKSGWGFVARVFGSWPLIVIGRAIYRLIARNRLRISKWLRLPATCSIDGGNPVS